jgi:LPXTG-motif cell wall-anchored protein
VRVERRATALLAYLLAGTLFVPAPSPSETAGTAQAPSAADFFIRPFNAARQAAEPVPLLELVSGSGNGRLYTLDHQEALGAVRDHGMRLQPGRVGYLPRAEVEGAVPMYRLKRSASASGWLFTTSTSERDSLVAGGWVAEGVTGYVYRDPGPGRERLLRFTNGREWRLALESKTTELQRAGYRVDGPLGYVHGTWIRAGAVYFGMFHPGGHSTIIRRSQEEYGCTSECWWGGVRDFRDGHPNSGEWPAEDWSYLQPSIGYYDDSRPETVERHIEQATSAGLSYFSFYWYWHSHTQQERVSGPALDAFLAARNRNAIDFNVSVCAHPWENLEIPQADYNTVARLLVDEYLSQDNALRANDGRKIVTICDTRGLGDGTVAQVKGFVDTLRQRARQELGEDIYVMINQSALNPRRVPEAGGDASFCATDGPAITNGSYQRYVSGQRAFYQQASGAYGRCVISDFDERPRYPIEQTDPAEIRWFPDHTMDLFRQAVRNARQDITTSTRPQAVDNLVLFYAWNEWHEGGVIEPNARDGCAYLDIIRAELALTQGAGCSVEAGPPPSTTTTAAPLTATTAVPSTTTTAAPTTAASGPTQEVAATREGRGELAQTGSGKTLPLVLAGAALVAVGTGTVFGVRRFRKLRTVD